MSDYAYFGFMIAAIALITAWMFTKSRYHLGIRMTAASAVLGLALSSWIHVVALLGYSIDELPPDGSVVLAMVPDKGADTLYIWTGTDYGPRAYHVPYGSELSQQLMRAEQAAKAQGGGRLVIHYGKQGKGGKGNDGNGDPGSQGGNGRGRSPIAGAQGPSVEIDVIPTLPEKSHG